MQEIEVKLGFDPQNSDATGRALDKLFGQPSHRKNLKNIYFDTPTQDLRKLGWSLRVRDKDGGFEQTVKGRGVVQAGLHQRFEVNQPIEYFKLDVTKLAEVSEIQPYLGALQPVFSTDFLRVAWDIESNHSQIELALDNGKVSAQGKGQTISELELELKTGNTQDILEMGARIAAKIPCWLLSDSKAKRGYELLADSKSSPAYQMESKSLGEWVSNMGVFAQQLTAATLTDEYYVERFNALIQQLKATLGGEADVNPKVRGLAEKLVNTYEQHLIPDDKITISSLRQTIGNTTLLGDLGLAIVSDVP